MAAACSVRQLENDPLVSVVMPAYNAEKYVADAIKSILTQTYTNLELIVINDGSTDKTADIVGGIPDNRIVFVDNKENAGQSTVRNQGISLAKGKYIAMMDADDESLPTRLQLQVNFMEKNPEVGILGTAALLVKDGRVVKKLKRPVSHFACVQHISATCPFLHNSVMIRKSAIPPGVRYGEGYAYAEDTKLWMDFYNRGVKMANLKEALVTYRIHGENVSMLHTKEQQKNSVALRAEFIESLIGESLARKYKGEIAWLTEGEFFADSKVHIADITSFYNSLDKKQRKMLKVIFERPIRYNLPNINYRYSRKIPLKWTFFYARHRIKSAIVNPLNRRSARGKP